MDFDLFLEKYLLAMYSSSLKKKKPSCGAMDNNVLHFTSKQKIKGTKPDLYLSLMG